MDISTEKLSFVIPCYGSEHTIENVVKDIIDTVAEKFKYEIICVNDCSPDNVLDKLCDLAKSNNNIKVVNLAKNFGQQNAILAGYNYVTGDYVITLDDDGQTDPKQCLKLLEKIGPSVDVVYAKYPQKKHSAFRNFGTFVTRMMNRWLIDLPKNISVTSYFASKRFVINEICRYDNPYAFMSGLILRSTRKLANVDIEHFERASGHSGYSLKKLLSLWLDGFTNFSIKPLRLASFVGFLTSMVGLLYALFCIVRKFLNPNILLGYSSIMSALLFIGGIIMLMLGMIGEYIGRIYICINKAPQYVIRNTINIEE